MIISEQSDFRRYASVNKHFSKVCDFLENTNLTDLVDGKIDIDGENVFANCMTFSEEKDIAFYDSKDYQIVELLPGNMLVTFEEDLHQPKIHCNDETVKKLVIKVLNEEK